MHSICIYMGFLSGSAVKIPSAIQKPQKMRVQSLGQKDPLKEKMTTHSSLVAWRILWTEEPDRL